MLAHLWASIVRDSARNLGVTVRKLKSLCISQLTCLWASKLCDSAASLGVTVHMWHFSQCFWVAETRNSHATLGVMVRKRDITICPRIGVVRNSHVTLSVIVRKRDMQHVCSTFNDVHLPCYMMLMCYFVPSSRQAYICAEVIAAGFIVIQCLLEIFFGLSTAQLFL